MVTFKEASQDLLQPLVASKRGPFIVPPARYVIIHEIPYNGQIFQQRDLLLQFCSLIANSSSDKRRVTSIF